MAPAVSTASSSPKAVLERKPLLLKSSTSHVSFSESESQQTTAESAKDLEAGSATDDDVEADGAYDSDEASDLEENDEVAAASKGGLCAKRMNKRHR